MLARGDSRRRNPARRRPQRHKNESSAMSAITPKTDGRCDTNARIHDPQAPAQPAPKPPTSPPPSMMARMRSCSPPKPPPANIRYAASNMMHKICARTEEDETYKEIMEEMRPDAIGDPSDAITTAAFYVAQDVDAACIVTYTMSGSTALRMARQRPDVPILCLTPDEGVARTLTLSYGVNAVHTPETAEDFTGPAAHAAEIVEQQNIAEKGERFVLTAGVPFGVSGTTNILRIAEVE